MLLKSLELNGFKSFPDKTVLTFEHGSTVVVGPNGSGKSNISDAMRWVLGEISSRNIRGTKMEDVIFGGTDKRRQMSYAEVSVTFDNTDGENSVDIPYDEVTVTRKYFRSGDSEYYINRKPVRLKDIHELFMNTGVGRTGYSIIGQGKISEIISLKSEERRGIFEEAAGIAKYKYKKNEAQKKLDGVSDNLTRVNDILSELSSRVGPLEKEAEKAKKYIEYFDIKKRADISLWIYDIDKLNEEIKKAGDDFIIAKQELEAINGTISSLEAQSERASQAAGENKIEYERMTQEIADCTKRMHELDSSSMMAQSNISHRESLKRLKESEIEKLNEKLLVIGDLIDKAHLAAEELDKLLEEKTKEQKALITESAQTAQAIKQKAELIDSLFEKIRINEKLINEKKLRLSALDTTRQTSSERHHNLLQSADAYRESLEILKDRISKADEKINVYDKNAAEIEQRLAKADATLAEYAKELERLDGESRENYINLSTKQQRVSALKRMDELFEGYSNSVRFVMGEYEKGSINGIGKIYGPVSKLIKVEQRYSLAIETALGANLQNIVVDNEGSAKAAIRHLKANNAGRATFYPVTSMKARISPVSEKEADKYCGFIGIADTIVGYDRVFEPVMKSLLGATLIFDDIDNATAMAKATGYKVRVVTLDGQIINAGGSFTGGSAKKESGILTRTSETQRLENEIKKLRESEDSVKKEIERISALSDKLKGECSGERNNLAIIDSLRNAEKTQREVLKTQAESDERLLADCEADISRIGEVDKSNTSEYESLTFDCQNLANENLEINNTRFELDSQKYELEVQNEKRLEEISQLNVAIAETGKDIESANERLAEKKSELEETKEAISVAAREIEKLEEDNVNALGSIESDRAIIKELEEKIISIESERQKNIEDGLALEKRRSDLSVKLRDNNDRRNNVSIEYTRLENRCINLNSEVDKKSSRLWDEYELTYSSTKECGYEEVTKDNRSRIAELQTQYRNKLRALGSVNVNAVEEYANVKERHDFLSAQVSDLEKSRNELLEIITKLESEMCEVFIKAFEDISRNFRIVFKELFGGGEAELILTDPDNVLTSGIEIRVAPPGKIIKSLMLLSGGEQSFVAIALIFAILRVNPTPFCIFDEIEAALDEANVFRFADYIKRYSDKNQFIVITHRRPTMEIADKLYGVTMYEKGISKVLTLEVGEIEEKVGIKS